MSLIKKVLGVKSNSWLEKELEEVFESGSEWSQVDPNIHPSGAFHACSRFIALTMLGYRGKFDKTTKRRLENGTYMHLRWTEYFRAIPSFVAADVPLVGDGVKGTCDILLKKPLTNKLIVGELKSVSPTGFVGLPTPGTPEENLKFFEKKYPGYVAQIMLYMQNIVYEGYQPADEGFFLFEDKGNQNYKIFWMKFDQDTLDRLVFNARIALSSLHAKLIPDPSFESSSKECTNCIKKRVCWDLYNEKEDIVKEFDRRLNNV